MSDIDLIPEDYRIWLSRKLVLRKHATVITLLIITAVISSVVIAGLARNAQAEATQLKTQNAITQQQQIQLESLKEQQAEYERQWALLRGLRAGAAAEDIFSIVDRSLSGTDLWFVEWKFRRAGVVVDGQQRGVETGYFIITSPDEKNTTGDKWQVETLMTIQGQVLDHQALSTFVRALFGQPGVKDVNVQKTSTNESANGRVVDFSLNVVLNSSVEES
jgi:hypothetical protein